MKLKELKNILNNLQEEFFDDYVIRLCYSHKDDSSYGFSVDKFTITGIDDIGHSDKIIVIGLEEE